MATIYAGDMSKVDLEVLETLKRLPDDFWVFAEFNADRNIDWFIVREIPEGSPPNKLSTLFVTELKRVSNVIRGTSENAVWEIQERPGEWRPIAPSNENDSNYYWQAVHATNALEQWLWNRQRLYRRPEDFQPESEFKAWPGLLLLSPPDVYHQLPMRPSSRYGSWWFSMEAWLDLLMTWTPKKGIRLTAVELRRLAEILGLRLVWKTPAAEPQIAISLPQDGPDVFVKWLYDLAERVEQLEATVADLQRQLEAVGSAHAGHNGVTPDGGAASPATPVLGGRPLTDEERQAMTAAVEYIGRYDQSRAVPNVIEKMSDLKVPGHLGYKLKETGYNGFLSATALLNQAEAEGLIRFGPKSGPNYTVYLRDE